MTRERLNTVDVDLDPKNPRIGATEEYGQSQLMEIMVTRFKLEDLAESILASGYLPVDPLLGYRADERVRVREGNRRVATLKLLLNPALAPERKRRMWQEFSARLSPQTRDAIQTIDITVYENENDSELEAYIGYRHVTGIMEWGAHEKARFIAHLADVQKWSYKQIAERLGSYPKHVERHYIAHQIMVQATEKMVPGASRVRLGVLLRALQAAGIAGFLGISYPGKPELSRSPIDEAHERNLLDFVRWTFGTDDLNPIVPDSRDLTRWGQILQSENALRYLRRSSNSTFERAWVKSGGERETVVESLLTAADRLEEAVPLAPQYKDQEDVVAAVKRCANFVNMLLAYFPNAKEGSGGTDV